MISQMPYTASLLEYVLSEAEKEDKEDSKSDLQYHPDVHGAHEEFVKTHDAMTDSPSHKTISDHESAWQKLKGHLKKHIPGCHDSMKESTAVRASAAQVHGVKSMNTTQASKFGVEYDSSAPNAASAWKVTGKGAPNMSAYTKEECEHALNEWLAQSQEDMPMDGKEDNYDKKLLKSAPAPKKVTSKSVMGGEDQDFEAPDVMDADKYSESNDFAAIEGPVRETWSESLGNETPSLLELQLMAEGSYSDFTEERKNESIQRYQEASKAAGAKHPSKDSDEDEDDDVEKDAKGKKTAFEEEEEDSGLEPGKELKEARCPRCTGQGCDLCDQEGWVSRKVESAIYEVLEKQGRDYGSQMMWSAQNPDPNGGNTGAYAPKPAPDQYSHMINEIHLARSRR
jgi:hypothetical protein